MGFDDDDVNGLDDYHLFKAQSGKVYIVRIWQNQNSSLRQIDFKTSAHSTFYDILLLLAYTHF